MPPPGKLLERLGILHERHLALGSSCKALQGRDTRSWANFRDRCMSGRSLGLVGSPVLGRVRSPALGPRVGSGLPTRSTGLVCSPPGSPGWVGSLALGPWVGSAPWPRVARSGWVPGPGLWVGSGLRPRSPGVVRSLVRVPMLGRVPGPGSPGRVGSGSQPSPRVGSVLWPWVPRSVRLPGPGPRVGLGPRPWVPGSGRVGSLVPGPRVGSGLWPGSPGRAGTPAPVQRVMSGPRTGSPARAPAAPSAATCWWKGGTAGSRAPRMRHGAHGRPLPPSPGGTGVLQAAGCRACAVLITSLFLLLCNFLRS